MDKNYRKICLEIAVKQATKMLEKGSQVQFNEHHKQFKAPL